MKGRPAVLALIVAALVLAACDPGYSTKFRNERSDTIRIFIDGGEPGPEGTGGLIAPGESIRVGGLDVPESFPVRIEAQTLDRELVCQLVLSREDLVARDFEITITPSGCDE